MGDCILRGIDMKNSVSDTRKAEGDAVIRCVAKLSCSDTRHPRTDSAYPILLLFSAPAFYCGFCDCTLPEKTQLFARQLACPTHDLGFAFHVCL